ncbi:MAG: hypothetical protein NTV97_03005 [Alphaproteobacteria bacterium]|nr:hypothetical protein [Alphaproteobacteria bacterium]
MLVDALILAVAVLAIVVLVERLRLPVFLAIMVAVVGYGYAADMNFQSIGKSFGLGFVAALEQAGLLVVAGALIGRLLMGQPMPTPAAAVSGLLGGLASSAAGTLAILQPAGDGAAQRALLLVLGLLAVHALVVPSPLAVAAATVLQADLARMLPIAVPVALFATVAGWLYIILVVPADATRGGFSLGWLVLGIVLSLVIMNAVAQMPTEPFGRTKVREYWTAISTPLMLTVLAVALALLLSRRWQRAALADTSWAPLLLAVGAAGGLARVLDETGFPELAAEQMLDPKYGLLAPFLAAATVKTMQGNSLSAVLTASGMVESMLPALGLDSVMGRVLAASAVGAGSIAVCHVNDPLFWIAASMARLSTGRALLLVSGGSAVVALGALLLLSLVRLFV